MHFIKVYDDLADYDYWLLPSDRGNAHLIVAPELQSDFEQDLNENSTVHSVYMSTSVHFPEKRDIRLLHLVIRKIEKICDNVFYKL